MVPNFVWGLRELFYGKSGTGAKKIRVQIQRLCKKEKGVLFAKALTGLARKILVGEFNLSLLVSWL